MAGAEFIEESNKTVTSLDNIKNTKCLVFEPRSGKLYERSGFGYNPTFIYERNSDMNFKIVLPLFYLLKYLPLSAEYPIFDELLNIMVIFLRKSSQNQREAIQQEYFKMIAQLIIDATPSIFSEHTIKSILHIKHVITDS